MSEQGELRTKIAQALIEWRDAGGPVEDIVWAIDDLIEKIVEDHLSEGNK